jgi:uncharacterized alkaline shock family protein YloU
MIALSLSMLLAAWHVIDEDFLHDWIYNFYTVWPNALILTGIAVVLLVLSIRLLYAGTTPPKKVTRALVKQFEAGSVSISLDTISEIARRHALAVDGVKEVRCVVVPSEDGIRLFYRISVEQDAVIPEKTRAIQVQVKERVEALTGATVKESSILVANPKPADNKRTNAGDIL